MNILREAVMSESMRRIYVEKRRSMLLKQQDSWQILWEPWA